MDFSNAIKNNMEDIVNDIIELCKINSVEGDPKEGMPLGEGPAKALQVALAMGDKMGFQTENFENYVGHIDFGDGEEMVGILAHVDVVPAGEGWSCDPFEGVIRDGKIIARGTLDDKGPAVVCLYAMKILKELGVPLKRKIRMILGTNEETGWKCMDHYLNVVKPVFPICSFSPDGSFPLTYGEKGILHCKIIKNLNETIKIDGGNAFNAVPATSMVELPSSLKDNLMKAIASYKGSCTFELQENGDKIILNTIGQAAHAACLQNGVNAISGMMAVLGNVSLEGELAEIVTAYNSHIGETLYGEKMGIDKSDEDSGPLTLNIGRVYVKENLLTIYLDMRIPVTYDVNDTSSALAEIFENDIFTMQVTTASPSLLIPKNSEIVTTLMSVYADVTGDTESQPETSGGGTYSRCVPNCVAFGSSLKGRPDVCHIKDEYVEIADLEIWLQIYLEALYRLAK